MDFMRENLQNLQTLPVLSKNGQDLSYAESQDGTMRIHTAQFQSNEYERIRLTLLDGGKHTQVFTSLWYPRSSIQPSQEERLPVLGCDLLQFHQTKLLCVSDMQPIDDGSTATQQRPLYEDLLRPIRDTYPALQNKMTKRFYDETQFFSKQMLLGRFDTTKQNDVIKSPHELVFDNVLPAYQQYVHTHVDLVQRQQAANADQVADGSSSDKIYSAYDTYSAQRDPAHGMLGRMFGQEWADAYVYDILFPSSVLQEEEA